MADESTESSTVENQEATGASEETGQSASAETENAENQATSTETQTEESHGTIPYDRFAKINDERKVAELRNTELEKQLELARAVEPKPKAVEATLEEPPEHLTDRQKISWYVNQDVERGLGMSLSDAKTLLASVPGVSEETYQAKWTRMCDSAKLDPKDRTTQDLVGGLVKQGQAIEDAMSVVSGLMGNKTGPSKAKTPQEMENGTTTHTMTSAKVAPVFDKKAAQELAQKGQRVEMLSTVDILKAASEHRKAAG